MDKEQFLKMMAQCWQIHCGQMVSLCCNNLTKQVMMNTVDSQMIVLRVILYMVITHADYVGGCGSGFSSLSVFRSITQKQMIPNLV